MQKKAELTLLEKFLTLIIAVILILFLFKILIDLYFNKERLEDQKKAEAVLNTGGENLRQIITDLKPGESKNLMLVSPSGWYLFSYTQPPQEGNQPAKCGLEKCLCICENVWDYASRQVKYCQQYGACIIIQDLNPYLEELEIPISSEEPYNLLIEKNNEGIISID